MYLVFPWLPTFEDRDHALSTRAKLLTHLSAFLYDRPQVITSDRTNLYVIVEEERHVPEQLYGTVQW